MDLSCLISYLLPNRILERDILKLQFHRVLIFLSRLLISWRNTNSAFNLSKPVSNVFLLFFKLKDRYIVMLEFLIHPQLGKRSWHSKVKISLNSVNVNLKCNLRKAFSNHFSLLSSNSPIVKEYHIHQWKWN